jgi:hypothetical protein
MGRGPRSDCIRLIIGLESKPKHRYVNVKFKTNPIRRGN